MMAELELHETEWLEPLRAYYAAAGAPLPPIEVIEGREVPAPYHGLLVHLRDMTSVLEDFHGGAIGIRLLRAERTNEVYARQVVLELASTRRPVEFGAIHIHLERFGPATRRLILEARRPLGGILKEHSIPYVSRPSAFIRVGADEVMSALLGIAGDRPLYGRQNVLYDPAARPLAEVIEILPPIGASASSEVHP